MFGYELSDTGIAFIALISIYFVVLSLSEFLHSWFVSRHDDVLKTLMFVPLLQIPTLIVILVISIFQIIKVPFWLQVTIWTLIKNKDYRVVEHDYYGAIIENVSLGIRVSRGRIRTSHQEIETRLFRRFLKGLEQPVKKTDPYKALYKVYKSFKKEGA